MAIKVVRLSKDAVPALIQHHRKLTPDDLRLRFGYPVPLPTIRTYVRSIDFIKDAVFGVFDDKLALVGVAHLSTSDPGVAELGFSVLPRWRRKGIGWALLRRSVQFARGAMIQELYLHYLAENSTVQHMASKLGMKVVSSVGEAEAHLALRPGNTMMAMDELLEQQLALVDYSVKQHVHAMRKAR